MLVFFGTSPRSAKFLQQAVQNGLKVDLVVSAPPKPVGKKQLLTENPTITTAKSLKIPFVQNISELFVIAIRQLAEKQSRLGLPRRPADDGTPCNDIGIILDYNKIIPNDIINLFPKGIINIHFSKLPQYRGSAPVQYTILNGDKKAWITYYLINEKLDAGLILAQTSLPLDQTENTETLYQKLITKAASETSKIISYRISNRKLSPQTGTPTYTKKLTTENCKINWSKSPAEIERLIRAAYPEPVAWTIVKLPQRNQTMKQFNNETISHPFFEIRRLKVHKAHLEQGKLLIDRVQLEGKNPVSFKQFKEGYPEVEIGAH